MVEKTFIAIENLNSRLVMKKRVLIVEDDFVIRQNMKDLLDWIGYKCETAENGLIALKLISECDYDLIITDYKMPLLDGVELIKVLRESKSTEAIPIILMNTSFDEPEFTNNEDEKINLLLTKPFDAKLLIDSIKNIFLN